MTSLRAAVLESREEQRRSGDDLSRGLPNQRSNGQSKRHSLEGAMQNATNIDGLWIGDGFGIAHR
jgi:hypothetical protein